MKRIVLMLFILLTLVVALASCGHDCEYVPNEALSKAPTCTEDGYTVSVCGECDEQQLVPVAKLGHDYVDTVIPATCQAEGYTESVCSRCQDKQVKDKVPTVEHTYVACPEKNQAPTCTEKGYEAVKCSVCGDERKINQANYPPTGHTWEEVTEWTNNIAPDCMTAATGWKYEKCSVCGVPNEAVQKTQVTYTVGQYPHDYKLQETSPATCQQPGREFWACQVCGTPDIKETEAKKPCTFAPTGKIVVEATCYNAQRIEEKCIYPDHTQNNTREVDVSGSILPHTPNVTNADCATDKYCIVCAEEFLGEGVVPTDADYGTTCPNANPADGKCMFCIYEKVSDEKIGKVHLFAKATGEHSGERDLAQTVDATCMQEGKYVRVCANKIENGTKTCGYCYTLEEDIIPIDEDAHKYGDAFDQEGNADKITPATCVTYAYKSKTCENCDTAGTRCDEQIKVELPELGYAPHTFTNAEHTGTIICENANCKLALYDTTYSKDVIYETGTGTTEDFGDGSELTVIITGTKTDVDGEGNPIDKHPVLNKTNTTTTLSATAGADGVGNNVKAIYIEKTGDITVTVKVNGTDYTVDENGYVHLNAEEIDVTSIEITASTESDTASAKVYFYSSTIING